MSHDRPPAIPLGAYVRDTVGNVEGTVVGKTEWSDGRLTAILQPRSLDEVHLPPLVDIGLERLLIIGALEPAPPPPRW